MFTRIVLLVFIFSLSLNMYSMAQPRFECENEALVSLNTGTPTDPTTLYRLNGDVGLFSLTPIGSDSHGFSYNALGYRLLDRYAYAIEFRSNNLLLIGGDGSVVNLGAIAGLPVDEYLNGTFTPNGIFYVKSFGSGDLMYAVNVDTVSATAITLDAPVDIVDFSYDEVTGSLMAVERLDTGVIYSITPDGIVTQTISNTLQIGFMGGHWNKDDKFFGYRTTTPNQGIYEINPVASTITFLGDTGELFSAIDATTCIPPTSIPALSTWGYIIMATIIGIIGLMVIRRRVVIE